MNHSFCPVLAVFESGQSSCDTTNTTDDKCTETQVILSQLYTTNTHHNFA